MRALIRILSYTICLALAVRAAPAQQPGSTANGAAELIAREKLRSTVEQALATYTQPAESGAVEVDNFVRAAQQLVEAGPGVAPYLINELEQTIPNTFFLCAYALGLLDTAEAETALRQAVEQCEREKGRYPVYRKAWAVLALAMMGEADALDLLNAGEHKAGIVPIHARWAALQTVALHTYPESIPRLLSLLDLYADDADMRNQRALVLKALRQLADPSTLPKLKEVMQESDPKMRAGAARALGAIKSPEAVAAALAALGDDDGIVRRAAAWSLLQSGSAVDPAMVLAKLETEDDPATRGSLYELAARQGGAQVVPALIQQWGRAEGNDRAGLMQALGITRSDEALPTIRKGLYDRDGRVITFATEALGAINNDSALEMLIAAVRSSNPLTALEAVKVLRKLRATEAAPAIAERLLKVELLGTLRDARFRSRAELLSETLVDLRHHEVLDDLRKATAKQTDTQMIRFIERVISRLEAIERNGRKVKKWITSAASPDEQIRLLAYEQLGESGGAPAARTLADAFGRVDPDEGLEILRALGGTNQPPALELIERVLLAPEFDAIERSELRQMAAWSARRLGGERMLGALRESVKRRLGRDVHVLIYLALLGGEEALPTLAEYRLLRMKYVGWMSGKELEKLDWISRHISAGRSISEVDVPPEEILFN